MTEEQIKEAAENYAENKSSSDVFREGHIADFIAGANYAMENQWLELPAKELLQPNYYAIRISHNGFADVKFEYIDNQIIPYHYATHYVAIKLPQPPKSK